MNRFGLAVKPVGEFFQIVGCGIAVVPPDKLMLTIEHVRPGNELEAVRTGRRKPRMRKFVLTVDEAIEVTKSIEMTVAFLGTLKGDKS